MTDSKKHPEIFTVEPLQEHKQSIIILHGRGDRGMQFGGPLLFTKLPDGRIFREALANAKFFFPTAPLILAEISESHKMWEWFNISSLVDPSEDSEDQVDGLVQSTNVVHELLREQIEIVGASNVVLGGLSQGCATSLTALILWDGPPLKAVFGMSGWLPMVKVLQSAMDNAGMEQNSRVAPQALQKELALELKDVSATFKTPVFICHGGEDEKVARELGEEAASCMKRMGFSVEWQEYEDLPHWYDGLEMQHIASFIKRSMPAE